MVAPLPPTVSVKLQKVSETKLEDGDAETKAQHCLFAFCLSGRIQTLSLYYYKHEVWIMCRIVSGQELTSHV